MIVYLLLLIHIYLCSQQESEISNIEAGIELKVTDITTRNENEEEKENFPDNITAAPIQTTRLKR